jgi:hypothetical protein
MTAPFAMRLRVMGVKDSNGWPKQMAEVRLEGNVSGVGPPSQMVIFVEPSKVKEFLWYGAVVEVVITQGGAP